jgi:regulatory protein
MLQDKSRRIAKAPRLTAASLENAAVHYLERFSASTHNLRRVLNNRVLRARRHGGAVPPDIDATIEAVIDKLVRLKLIDDEAFAVQRSLSLRRRGGSLRQIRGKLRLAGIDAEGIDQAVEAADTEFAEGDDGAGELRAALRLAQRRRLGPYRLKQRADHRDRDLAALARAGFSLDTARRVVDAASAEALLAEAD